MQRETCLLHHFVGLASKLFQEFDFFFATVFGFDVLTLQLIENKLISPFSDERISYLMLQIILHFFALVIDQLSQFVFFIL